MALHTRSNVLADTIRRLLRRNAKANLHKILQKTHPSEIAYVFKHISPTERLAIFNMLPSDDAAAEVLAEIHDQMLVDLAERIPIERLVEILYLMASDDTALLLSQLPDEMRKELLDRMKNEESEDVEELLSYPEDTAGRIMNPNFFSLTENITARDAQKEIRQAAEAEMVFYVYVTDDQQRLAGVVSLRDLVVVPPDTTLDSIMTREVVKVYASEDQEDVARIVAQYDILAVPVVDIDGRLIGIITVDDVVDVIRAEATEDILRMAGTSGEEITSFSVLKAARIRLPWLLAAFIGGVLAWLIIGRFEATLSRVVVLAAFLPVILGMGGNIGTQSSTIAVRGLATGRIQLGQFWRVVFKEIGVGLLLGVTYALFLFCIAYFTSLNDAAGISPVRLGLVVSIAIVANMTLAASLGVFLPMTFHRLHIDPAISSGPFVTTAIDIIGVTVYFALANAIIL